MHGGEIFRMHGSIIYKVNLTEFNTQSMNKDWHNIMHVLMKNVRQGHMTTWP